MNWNLRYLVRIMLTIFLNLLNLKPSVAFWFVSKDKLCIYEPIISFVWKTNLSNLLELAQLFTGLPSYFKLSLICGTGISKQQIWSLSRHPFFQDFCKEFCHALANNKSKKYIRKRTKVAVNLTHISDKTLNDLNHICLAVCKLSFSLSCFN